MSNPWFWVFCLLHWAIILYIVIDYRKDKAKNDGSLNFDSIIWCPDPPKEDYVPPRERTKGAYTPNIPSDPPKPSIPED